MDFYLSFRENGEREELLSELLTIDEINYLLFALREKLELIEKRSCKAVMQYRDDNMRKDISFEDAMSYKAYKHLEELLELTLDFKDDGGGDDPDDGEEEDAPEEEEEEGDIENVGQKEQVQLKIRRIA